MSERDYPIIAVSIHDLEVLGCPHCGFRCGTMPMRTSQGTGIWSCDECWRICCILNDDVTKSAIGVDGVYPELQDHPRRSKPIYPILGQVIKRFRRAFNK